MLVYALAVAVISPGEFASTAAVEHTGPSWSEHAMGTQDTFQSIIYVVTFPAPGTIVVVTGFPAPFAVTALFPTAALDVAPREDQNRYGRAELD